MRLETKSLTIGSRFGEWRVCSGGVQTIYRGAAARSPIALAKWASTIDISPSARQAVGGEKRLVALYQPRIIR